MTPFRLFVLDDDDPQDWLPFTLTRPVGEVLFGTETLRARIERAVGRPCEGHLTDSRLVGFREPGAPPCVGVGEVGVESGRLFLSGRFVPDDALDFGDRLLQRLGEEPVLLTTGRPAPEGATAGGSPPCDVLPAGAWLPPGVPLPPRLGAGRRPDWATVPVEGRLLRSPWELIDANADRIRADAERFADSDAPASVHRLGDGRIALGEGATVEPGVVLDAADGPIVLEAGVQVRAHSRVAGPFYAGAGATVLGGAVSASSLGPCCRVRGEVEATVALGYVNKAHDGFLGRSIVGRWANLGAMTTNSDLKNSYGLVRARIRDRTIDTGLLKAGCLLGDHVKTAIGTLLTTGAVVEAGSVLFGGGLAPKCVPPFCWGTGSDAAEHDVERFLDTAERVMARRGVELAEEMRALYRRAFADTAATRRKVLARWAAEAGARRESVAHGEAGGRGKAVVHGEAGGRGKAVARGEAHGRSTAQSGPPARSRPG